MQTRQTQKFMAAAAAQAKWFEEASLRTSELLYMKIYLMGLAATGHEPKASGEQRVAERCERIMRQFDLEGGEGS